MSRNGSGTYSLPSNSWNPAINGVPATAADWQSLINDVASALTQSVSKDGQTPLTGNLAAGGNKITGLAAATAAGDALRFEQLFNLGALTDIASAVTTDIGAQLSTMLRVTGTTGITSFGANYNGPRFLIFVGVVTLTHSASLVLPGAANITTAANDSLIAVPISGGWQVVAFQRAANLPAIAGPLASSGITGAAASGANADITSLTALTSAVKEIRQLQPITASIASNAITITPSALSLEFRNTTLTDGAVSFVEGTPSALVIAATDSFGLVTAAGNQRIAILAINNAGTIELAATPLAGGYNIDETGVISTGVTPMTSTSGRLSAVARTNVAYRVIGFVDATFTTGTGWGSLALVQGTGGQAMAAMSSLGYGQTWQNVGLSAGTTYYNTLGRPRKVQIVCVASTNVPYAQLTVSGLLVSHWNFNGANAAGVSGTVEAIIPPGASYSLALSNMTVTLWSELR